MIILKLREAMQAYRRVPLRVDDRFASETALLESSGTRPIVRCLNSATRPNSIVF